MVVLQAIPRVMRPLFRGMLRWRWSRDLIGLMVNSLAWNADMICSECLVRCPFLNVRAPGRS